MKRDSIIVASHWITPNLKLSEESIKRVEKGVDLLNKGFSEYIIMNGGPGQYTEPVNGSKLVKRNSGIPPHCNLMKEYATKIGVPENNILTQNYSSDTIGEAFFVKGLILEPKGFKNNFLVTSDYHILRSTGIYNYVLGDEYLTEFVSVNIPEKHNNELEREIIKLNQFFEQMKESPPGDNLKIQEALYNNHGIYNKIPLSERLILYK